MVKITLNETDMVPTPLPEETWSHLVTEVTPGRGYLADSTHEPSGHATALQQGSHNTEPLQGRTGSINM